MQSWSLFAGALAGLFALAGVASAEDKKDTKPAGPVVLKVVSKKDKYLFDGSGKTAKEYKEYLDDLAKQQDKGERVMPPKAMPVDLVLQFENTSKENVTIYLGGTPNTWTFDMTGGTGVVNLRNPVAFPAIFRLPTAVTIEPGKSHEIPVASLGDGRGGIARLVFWTGPGEYKLVAKYQLADAKGGKTEELKSEPVTIKVTEK